MGTKNTFVKLRGFTWQAWLAAGLCVATAVSAGCRTTTSNSIAATELPMQFRAQKRSIEPPIDLSALAQSALDSDLIYPGDYLKITVVTGADGETPEGLAYHVSPNGQIELPLIGSVNVVGRSLTQAEEDIRRAAIERRIYRNPIVAVQLESRQTDSVRIVGAVQAPGVYELPRAGNDLLAAITAAKGLTELAGTSIEIRHPAISSSGIEPASFEPGEASPQSLHVDLVDAMTGNAGDLSLRDGSVVMVHEHRPQTIYVQGLVKQAGEFELPKDKPLRVDQAIALAKGRELEFADLVHITRFVEGRSEPIVIEVSMKEAKTNRDANVVLMPGDVVSVEETPTTFTIDFLRKFFRIGFSSAIPGF